MLIYSVTAAPAVDSDVKSRSITVMVNGEVRDVQTFDAAATSFGELGFADGDEVVITLIDRDDAGNESTPAVVEFRAADTLPPAKPGEFGVSLVREE